MQGLDGTKLLLRRMWSPVVMVAASPDAEEVCRGATGLAVDELLRPFGVLRQLNGGLGVPVRTVAEQSLRLHQWLLRFHAGSTMFQPEPQAADTFLSGLLSRAAAAAGDAPEMAQLIATADSEDATPWYTQYREEYLRMLAFGAHEAMDHPVACLLVLPSTFVGDPAAAFAALLQRGMPPLMKQGVMDPLMLRHHVLLHDAAISPPEDLARAQQRVKQMSAALGAPCHLLVINSASSHPLGGAPAGLWAAALHGIVPGGGAGEAAARPPPPAGGLGAGLSQEDVAGVAAFVQELAVHSIIPHVEARIRALDRTATAARRGLRNQLKSLLFRKSTAGSDAGASAASTEGAAAADGGPASYPYTSIEAQLRQLSDLCMMVGDFETATSTLRLLAADFKADKAFKHYAGVQEAMAVATVLSDGSSVEAVASFREAFYRYNSLPAAAPGAAAGVWYATRCAMLMAAYLGATGRHADANWIAMKAHYQEDDLRGALLLESAAHSLLRLRPPQVRKFAFHLVLAGLRYNQGGQRALARRAYAQVLEVYAARGWATIEEHVQEALGKQCEEGGDTAGAVRHFAATLLCPGVSEAMQRTHVEQFTLALRRASAELGYAPTLELPLPVIDTQHVGLSVAGQASYANVQARQVALEEWAPLEAALQPAADAGPTWLDGGSRGNLRDHPLHHSCCVGEDIGLDVDLTNPLHINLAVTRLRLICEFEPAAGAATTAATAAPATSPTATSPRPDAPLFQVREEKITLHGGERALVHLRVRPLRPGTLTVNGVAWVLEGEAHGQRSFQIPRPRPRKPGSSVILLDAERPPPGGLSFTVLPPMPRLEASLEGLPATMLDGQLVRATLRLKNTGAMTLHNLSMAAGSGDMFLGEGGAEVEPGGGTAPAVAASMRQGVPVFCLPGAKLGVQEEMSLPLWFRPTRPGPTRLTLAWYYEPVVRLDALRFRTLRAAFAASTLPSLQLAATAAPAAAAPGSYLLQLQALNLQGLEAFKLTGLSLLGGAWGAIQLAGGDKPAAGSPRSRLALDVDLAPEASAGLHFHLTPRGDAAGASVVQANLSPVEVYLCRSMAPTGAPAAAPDQRGGGSRPVLGLPSLQPRDVVLSWTATSAAGEPPVQGFHSVSYVRFQQGPPIHAQLKAPAKVTHDFTDQPVCIIDVVLHVRNMLAMPAAVQVDTSRYEDGSVVAPGVATWRPAAAEEPSSSPVGSSSRSSASAPTSPAAAAAVPNGVAPVRQFVWCGSTRATLLSVPAGRAVEVPLRVAVTRPGWLALADYVVSWRYEGAPQLAGTLQGPPCFVHVGGA